MLIYHDGLPGSGKTYEAMVKHVLPALQSGRTVYARVDGLDHQKIAAILEMDIDVIKGLLIHIESSQVLKIDQYIACDNSLVVIDELQNYWPSNKAKLPDNITRFVSEHRHRGLDILCMGQDYRDAHNLFKRRIDRKISFMNLDVVGSAKSYKWNLYKLVGERFQKVSSGIERYEEKYFGIYKSHESSDINTENYKSKRFVIWNDRTFRLALLFIVLVLIFMPYYLYNFFHSSSSSSFSSSDAVSHVPVPVPANPVPSASLPTLIPTQIPKPIPSKDDKDSELKKDYIYNMSLSYRVRLTALISEVPSPNQPNKVYVVVEFRDSSYRVQERMDVESLVSLGWRVSIVNDRLVKLYKAGFPELVVTPWPIEAFSRVSDEQTEAIRNSSSGSGSGAGSGSGSGASSGSGAGAGAEPEKTNPIYAQPLLTRSNSFKAPSPMGHMGMR